MSHSIPSGNRIVNDGQRRSTTVNGEVARWRGGGVAGWRGGGGALALQKPPKLKSFCRGFPRSGCALTTVSPEFGAGSGCHDLGVCDKVVPNLSSGSFHNRSPLSRHTISRMLKFHRRHGFVEDSKTVAPIP